MSDTLNRWFDLVALLVDELGDQDVPMEEIIRTAGFVISQVDQVTL